jgi:hypothetical protein
MRRGGSGAAHGYFDHLGPRTSASGIQQMTQAQVATAYGHMQTYGVIDPSDFIDGNRPRPRLSQPVPRPPTMPHLNGGPGSPPPAKWGEFGQVTIDAAPFGEDMVALLDELV